MRTFLIILSIIILLGIGLFLKKRGIIFNKVIKETDQLVTKENTSKTLLKPTLKEWHEVLKGEWVIRFIEASEHSSRLVKGTIDFNENKNFNAQITAKSFIRFIDYNSDIENDAKYVEGGTVSGTWDMVQNALKFTQETCDIVKSYSYYSTDSLGCDYFNTRILGNVTGKIFTLEINTFNQDTILISGRDFSKDGLLTYQFTRNK